MDGSDIQIKPQPILLNDLYIDPVGYQVKVGKKEVELTLKEFNLLYLFARNSGKVVRREEVLRTISDPNTIEEEGAVNVVVCRLRKKIESDPHHPKRLVSIRGLGYRLKG
jgi:DNA-binding response OmpR family regulator